MDNLGFYNLIRLDKVRVKGLVCKETVMLCWWIVKMNVWFHQRVS